jgi:hypothetical protein
MQHTAPLTADIGEVPDWGRGFGTNFEIDRLKMAKTLKTMLFFFYAINLCYLRSVSDAFMKHPG